MASHALNKIMIKANHSKTNNMIQNAVSKEMTPKIYAITVENKNGFEHLGIAVDFCLENAIVDIKRQAAEANRGEPRDFHTRLWAIMEMAELKNILFKTELKNLRDNASSDRLVTVNKKSESINDIMKKIINDGDLKLFAKMKEKLTEQEQNYLQEKLNLKSEEKSE